jgi:cell wall-associated NlpC family hydrolase
MTTRADIVAEARSYIGTPFHHQGRLKGVGVDCAGLPLCIARTFGLVEADFDVQGYPRQADGVSLLGWCDETMQRIGRSDMQRGDVVVVAYDEHPQHLGILGDYLHGGLSIIHSSSVAKRVIETRLMFTRSMRFQAAYVLPGVESWPS